MFTKFLCLLITMSLLSLNTAKADTYQCYSLKGEDGSVSSLKGLSTDRVTELCNAPGSSCEGKPNCSAIPPALPLKKKSSFF